MENVGCITFTDNYLKPKNEFNDFWKTMLSYVTLHELSHMWFGDLATMEWWGDLWLKESFANYLGATNLLENPAFSNYKNVEQQYLNYLYRAMRADIK